MERMLVVSRKFAYRRLSSKGEGAGRDEKNMNWHKLRVARLQATKDYRFSREGSRQDILEWRECLWSAENSHIEHYLQRGRGQDGTKKT